MTLPLIILLGATASGKTRLGVELASTLNGEIISADSRQVFRGMDIGTGKDLEEYGNVPYHLIDIADAGTEFSVFDFVMAFNKAFEQISQRNRLPFLVGGTGLYLKAIIERYSFTHAPISDSFRQTIKDRPHQDLIDQLLKLKPDQHNQTDLLERERTIRALEIALAEQSGTAKQVQVAPHQSIIFGIRWPREEQKSRITQRLKARLENGMIEEVEQLQTQGVSWAQLHHYGLEYRFIGDYLQGKLNYNDMYQKLNAAIHYFAKQQEKWFRKLERDNVNIHWLSHKDIENTESVLNQIRQMLKLE